MQIEVKQEHDSGVNIWVELWVKCRICKASESVTQCANKRRLYSAQVCQTCDFWVEKWQMRNDSDVLRVNGEHYIVGNHLDDYRVDPSDSLESIAKNFKSNKPRRNKGMGGRQYIVKFNDGRIAITDDLWHQGEVPERWAHLLPNNAELVAV